MDESKCVEELGNFPVPVEVLPDASRMVMQALEDMGAECEIRMAQRKDGPVITDNGNFVIDAKFEKIELDSELARQKEFGEIRKATEYYSVEEEKEDYCRIQRKKRQWGIVR